MVCSFVFIYWEFICLIVKLDDMFDLQGVEFVLEGISTTTHPQEFLTIIGQNFGKSPDQQVGLTVPEAAADEELVSNEVASLQFTLLNVCLCVGITMH